MKGTFNKAIRPDFVENLKDVVNVQVETDKDSLTSLLNDHKVVVTITKGPKVITKMVKVAGERKKTAAPKRTVPQETRERVKTMKTLVKNNADASYVFILVEQLKDNIKKLNMKDMTPEAAKMFNTEIKALIDGLSSTQNLLLTKSK